MINVGSFWQNRPSRVVLRVRDNFLGFVSRSGKRNSNKFCQSIPSPEANNCALWRIPYVEHSGGRRRVGKCEIRCASPSFFFFIPSDQDQRTIVHIVVGRQDRIAGAVGRQFCSKWPGPSLWLCPYVWRGNASGTGSNASPHSVAHGRDVYRSPTKTIFVQDRTLDCDLLRENWKRNSVLASDL